MPKQVFLIADTTAELVRGRSVPTQMVDDLVTVSSVPTEAIDRLAEVLEREPGIPTTARLAELVRECVTDEPHIAAVMAALLNLRRERVESILRDLGEWRSASPENAKRLSEPTLSAIREQLGRLILDYAVLDRYRKAQRLMALTGSTVEDVQILCDIRPVFDKDRRVVEGLIPLTTLKLEYQRQDEDAGVLEVLVSEAMLNELIDKATKAKQKLEVLRDSGSVWLPHGWVEEDISSGWR